MKDLQLESNISLDQISLNGELFFRITNNDLMRPFFMNIVSDSNHWMFISSNGGLTAGRKNSEFALFPYYSEDKITESTDTTGSKSIFRVSRNAEEFLWEPFSVRQQGSYRTSRNVYKNIYGNKIRFEEINHDLELCFTYQWSNSDNFGFIRHASIKNLGNQCTINILDGIQNIIPAGVQTEAQNSTSNLVDAYKWNQLDKTSGLGIYALSAIIVDRAEPSEALKANVVWSYGLNRPSCLLSSMQLDKFRNGVTINPESEIKAEKGAYFVLADFELGDDQSKEWLVVADVNKDQSDVVSLIETINNEPNLLNRIEEDIALGTENLMNYVASADGFQKTVDKLRDSRHFSNVLFNIMRGGIIDNNYVIEKTDFLPYLEKANKQIFSNFKSRFGVFKDKFTLDDLRSLASSSDDPNFKRLCLEYLPLKFSRRHGDPSRPWNKFSINIRNENDGSKILDYEGNWRDIFQNWEALVHSYPEYIEGMIAKFLNASTFDGYNPYRVTKSGFDWETIEADDPWSYIGYWGDHQIIYLLKFLEFIQNHSPVELSNNLNQSDYVYAKVPYKIKSYDDIITNSKDTIDFDHDSDQNIRSQRDHIGADGALWKNSKGAIHNVNFLEKILATVLSKISNFIPEGGIWMNTQRPEWNDANNALVGNGVSMVTLYYLRRFLSFFQSVAENSPFEKAELSSELVGFFRNVYNVLNEHRNKLKIGITDIDRRSIVDGLGQAGSDYRIKIYNNGFSGNKDLISNDELNLFIITSLEYLEHSIRANKRTDNMYHAYNLMSLEQEGGIKISYLDEMLEGQVAVLNSGFLSPQECLDVLDAMKQSKLFRKDQYSYILYPDKELKGFLEKNTLDAATVTKSRLLDKMLKNGDTRIIRKDIKGKYHFNGNFRNAFELEAGLNALKGSAYEDLSGSEKSLILEMFEDVFNHKAFTGRSGTFFGYEGLGSIYWHMVSKLLLAVQECCLKAMEENVDESKTGRLLEHYYEINEGIGVHKSPELYGAFPTDAYSHTPAGRGAQQPGMTGQVKEDILSRFGELGVSVENGQLGFNPCMLRKDEFLSDASKLSYFNTNNEKNQIDLEKNTLCFTYCQVPVIYKIAERNNIDISFSSGDSLSSDSMILDMETSKKIFKRTGEVEKITVHVQSSYLK